jgi:predicted O-methyltransferase YrrM
MKITERFFLALLDVLLLPFVIPAGLVLKAVRRVSLHRLLLCRAVLLRIGVLPIRRHYYEPFIEPDRIPRALDAERELPGVNWSIEHQLAQLEDLRYEHELPDLQAPRKNPLEFRLNNGSFESGDAEYLYQIVRAKKPRRVFEIGSGNSTLMVRRSIARNSEEESNYSCKHVCIEPFEAPWLDQSGVVVLRQRVEDVDRALFRELRENDLLFIDSSHVIRPQGDVLFEYLEILPSLHPGVIVHIHDIFSPRDYPREWVIDRLRLWNEQYLLEAFLSQNDSWRVIGALNLLHHSHFDSLKRVCPYLSPDREPGSLYIQKIK